MRHRPAVALALLSLAAALPTAAAPVPYRVRDINTIPSGSYPQNFLETPGTTWFNAHTNRLGQELWRTDGSVAGTVLVADACSGPCDLWPEWITAIGGGVVFNGRGRLWWSDGSATGTVQLADVGLSQEPLVAAAGLVFFSAADSTSGQGTELYATDGTPAGTRLVRDICPGPCLGRPEHLVAAGGVVFFRASDGVNGRELWQSDGTAAGTFMVQDVLPGGSSEPRLLGARGGSVLFFASDGVSGRELWQSDGTAAGTMLVKDICPGPCSSDTGFTVNPVGPAALLGGSLHFAARDGSSGPEPWRSDGTASGTERLVDSEPGTAHAPPREPIVAGSTLFFVSGSGALWASDGTPGGTRRLRPFAIGGDCPLGVSDLAPLGSAVLFAACDPATGAELWTSDGTAAGTALLADINPGSASSMPVGLAPGAAGLLFTADDGINGSELWRSDGSAAGTALLKRLDPGGNRGSSPSRFAAIGGQAYFGANDGRSGYELWRSDGTEAGTVQVSDINPGPANTFLGPANPLGSGVAFLADDPSAGIELWRSDGTAGGTMRVSDINPGPPDGASPIVDPTSLPGGVYLPATDGATGLELWWSDGSSVTQVADLAPGPDGSSPYCFTSLGGGIVVFATADVFPGVWRTDGTPGGTQLLSPVAGRGIDGTPPWHSPFPRFSFLAGNLYFSGREAATGQELWRTDGTPAGTALVRDICPGPCGNGIQSAVVAGGWLYFVADDGTGRELWRSDGSTAGTQMVADISATGSSPYHLVALGNDVVFRADDGVAGAELWRSDGTTAGTRPIADILPGPEGSFPQGLISAGGHVYFHVEASAEGRELWRSDGTAAGTERLTDLCPGPCDSMINGDGHELTVIGNRILFNADDGETGEELWAIDLDMAPGVLLLRAALASIDPPAPAPGSVLPLTPSRHRYLDAFTSGSIDPDLPVLTDRTRPLVFYGIDAPLDLRLVKSSGEVRIFF